MAYHFEAEIHALMCAHGLIPPLERDTQPDSKSDRILRAADDHDRSDDWGRAPFVNAGFIHTGWHTQTAPSIHAHIERESWS